MCAVQPSGGVVDHSAGEELLDGGPVPGQPVCNHGGERLLPRLTPGLATGGQEGETAPSPVYQVP